MATVQEIITWVDRKYPNQESDANKILDLDDIHKEIFVKLRVLKDDYLTYEITTVADQLQYTLPTDCTIDNIITIKVSQDTTITSTTQWDTYTYASLNEDISTGTYYAQAPSGTFALTKNGNPIDTSGYSIRIFYYKIPSKLTSVSDTPSLDADYHNLLKYALCQSLAAQGNDPDTAIADYWQSKYDEFYAWVEKDLRIRMNTKALDSSNTIQWW